MSTLQVNRFENTSGVAYGTVLQVQNSSTSSVITGTATIPFDDTIPQNTEGFQILSVSITPKSATNKLKISINTFVCNSNASSNTHQMALFQDSNANAIAATCQSNGAGFMTQINLIHYMTAGTTSSTTFNVRVGNNAAGTTTVNGQSSARLYGGVGMSSITVEEIQV
jgi:hypothetical protein